MKKILSCMLALFAAVSLYAADLNIYASGLKATQRGNVVFVNYTLNTQADSIMLMLYGEDINQAFPKVITEAAYLTAGKHELQLALPYEFPGTYHWAMKAFAPATTFAEAVTSNSPMYRYYLPQDVAVDNNYESPYFGRVYVSQSCDGASDGMSETTKTQTRGFFIYNPDLTFVNDSTSAHLGYDGGLGGARDSRAGFKRIAIDEQGYVYVASRDAATQGVYRMDPANPENAFVQVLAASEAVDAIGIIGSELYTMEGTGYVSSTTEKLGKLKKYNMATLPVGEPVAILGQDTVLGFASSDCDMFPDGRGGWWLAEHRYAVDAFPCLAHMTPNGVDYKIDNHNNSTLLSNSNGNATYRGVVTVNPEGNLLAMSSNKCGVVFSIAYDAETGVPTLTKVCQTPVLGGNIDGVAFDVANNLYIASASVERLYAYPIATENNNFVTPAPAANTVTIEAIGEVNDLYLIGGPNVWNPTIGTQMTKTADKVFEGTFTFTEETSYFAFSSVLAENNDNGGWAYVNSHRFAGEMADAPAVVGENYIAKTDLSFAIPAGTYKLTVNFNEMKMIVETVAPVEPVAPMYIAFKDVITAYSSDNSARVETIEATIKEGAEYVSAFASNDPKNIYNARNGYGLKLGTSSKTGSFTLTLANAVKPDSIIVRAAAYNDTEGAATILGESVDLAPYGNKMITPIVKVYDGNTDVTELTISSTKRLYVTDITIYPHGAVAPVIADRTFGLGAALYLNVDTIEQSHVKYWLDANAVQKAYFVNANGDSTTVEGVVNADSTKVKFMAPAGAFRYVGFARLNPENEAVWNNTALFDLRGTTGNYVKTWTRGSTGNGYNTVIWAEYEEPIPVVYKLKHPWAVGEEDAWIWKECAEQEDGTWMLEDIFYGTGCNIDPTILDQNWIGNPTLVGNPASGDSCRFVINPAATDVAGILTITKLGDPTPVTEYEHLYWIGNDQGWKPSEGVEMTKLSDNVFERAVVLADTTWFGFLTVQPAKVNDQEDWTTANQNRFGAISNNLLVGAGEANLLKGENAFMIAGGSYTITVNLNDMKMTIAQESSAIEGIKSESNIQKVFKNGHVYIIRDGVTYDTAGARIE